MGVVHNNSKAHKVGRPKEIQGLVKQYNLNLESSRMREFQELCDENGISLSEGVRQLIEHELEQNAMTTIGVEYGSKKKKDGEEEEQEGTKLLTLDDFRGDFMSDQEAMKRVESIPQELQPKAFSALNKMKQRLAFKMRAEEKQRKF